MALAVHSFARSVKPCMTKRTPCGTQKSGEFQTALRLGLAIVPLDFPTVQCGCGATLHRSDTDHGMRCSALAAQSLLCHDILKGILLRAVHRAGIASALEPRLRRRPGLAAGAGTSADGSAICPEARGNILMALPQGIFITDIFVIHPLSMNTLSSACCCECTCWVLLNVQCLFVCL
jgi:hypothetical protein